VANDYMFNPIPQEDEEDENTEPASSENQTTGQPQGNVQNQTSEESQSSEQGHGSQENQDMQESLIFDKAIKTGDFQTWIQFRKIQHSDPDSKTFAVLGDFHVLFAIAEGIGRVYKDNGLESMSCGFGITKQWYNLKDSDFQIAKHVLLLVYTALWNLLFTDFQEYIHEKFPRLNDQELNSRLTAAAFLEWGETLGTHKKIWFKFITEDGLCFRRFLEAIRYRNWNLRVTMMMLAVRLCNRAGKTHYERALMQHLYDLRYVIPKYYLEQFKLNFAVPCKDKADTFIALDELIEMLNKWIKSKMSVVLPSRIEYYTHMHNFISKLCDTFNSAHTIYRGTNSIKKIPKTIVDNFEKVLLEIDKTYDEAHHSSTSSHWWQNYKHKLLPILDNLMKPGVAQNPNSKYWNMPSRPVEIHQQEIAEDESMLDSSTMHTDEA